MPNDTRVYGERPIMAHGGKIDGLNAILFGPPTPSAAFRLYAVSIALAQPEVCREDRNLVPSPGQFPSKGADLDDGSSLFLKWIIGLNNFQDAHGGITFTPQNQTSYANQAQRSEIHSSHLQMTEEILAGGK